MPGRGKTSVGRAAAQQRVLGDLITGYKALAMCGAANYEEAVSELNHVTDLERTELLRARAAISLARGDFQHAEQMARRFLGAADLAGARRRPLFFWAHLSLADSLFGQAKHDDAFASFEEARAIVADFALPADDAWRKALATWLQRAKELGRSELAASIEKELAQVSATPMQAITILEKFRIQPPAST